MTRPHLALVLVGLAASCGNPTPSTRSAAPMVTVDPAPAVASSTAGSSSAVPSASAAPSSSARAGVNLDELADAKRTLSYAKFEHDVLSICTDLSIVLGDGRSAGPASDALDPSRLGADEMPLKKPCTETFADRVELASCVVGGAKGDSKYELALHIYSFEIAMKTDAAMRSCLKDNGTWKALDRTSDEFKNAEREARLRKLERALPK